MKKAFYTFFFLILVLQIEIVGLVFLHWGNMKVWNAQSRLNDSMIEFITSKSQ